LSRLVTEFEVRAARHGTNFGSRAVITLGEKERIKRIDGSSCNNVISHVTFTSENESGNITVHGPYGLRTREEFSVNGYVLGLKGSSMVRLTGLGVYYLPSVVRSNNTFGGSCSNTLHDDKVDSIIPPVVGISSIKIHHGLILDGIQITYLLMDGSHHRGNFIGFIELRTNEILYKLEVIPDNNDIVGIISIHSRFNGSIRFKGKYGAHSTTRAVQVVSGNILGFYGYSTYHEGLRNDLVSTIGVYRIN